MAGYSRSIYLTGDVNEAMAEKVVKEMAFHEKKSRSKPILVYISTYGGSVYDGLAIYSRLRASPCPVHTHGYGKVMSMGTVLILAGDTRSATKHTTFMFHAASMSIRNSKLHELVTETEETTRLEHMMEDIYAEHTNKSASWWRKFTKYEDKYRDENWALSLGVISQIV